MAKPRPFNLLSAEGPSAAKRSGQHTTDEREQRQTPTTSQLKRSRDSGAQSTNVARARGARAKTPTKPQPRLDRAQHRSRHPRQKMLRRAPAYAVVYATQRGATLEAERIGRAVDSRARAGYRKEGAGEGACRTGSSAIAAGACREGAGTRHRGDRTGVTQGGHPPRDGGSAL